LNPAFNDVTSINTQTAEQNESVDYRKDDQQIEHLVFENAADIVSNQEHSDPTLQRTISTEQTKIAPSRPPPPARPMRPPPPASRVKEVRDSVLHDEAFIENSEGSDRRSIVLPGSPFYSPSQDLLGLDQSLFHEIGSSLSEDTRVRLAMDQPNSAGGETSVSTNPFSLENNNHCPKISSRNPFSEQSSERRDVAAHELHRSPVLTRATSAPLKGDSGARSPPPNQNDPFASCFEDAKKDFHLTNKR